MWKTQFHYWRLKIPIGYKDELDTKFKRGRHLGKSSSGLSVFLSLVLRQLLMSFGTKVLRVLQRKCGNQGDDFEFVEYDAFQALTVGTRFTNGAIVNAERYVRSRSNRQSSTVNECALFKECL